jgi:hypothetical protein
MAISDVVRLCITISAHIFPERLDVLVDIKIVYMFSEKRAVFIIKTN